MAEQKITKREKNELLLEALNGKVLSAEQKQMLVEHINHEIELLDRKTSKGGTPTKAQEDALAIAEIAKDILAECEDENGMTVGALLKHPNMVAFKCYDGKDISSQKLTAVLTKLAPEDGKGDLVRSVIKKVAYFRLNYGISEGV